MRVLTWAVVPWIGVWIVVVVASIPPTTHSEYVDYAWVRALLSVLAALDGLALGFAIEILYTQHARSWRVLWTVVGRTVWSVFIMGALVALLVFQSPLREDDDKRRRPWWAVTCAYLTLVALEVVALTIWSGMLARRLCSAASASSPEAPLLPPLVVPVMTMTPAA